MLSLVKVLKWGGGGGEGDVKNVLSLVRCVYYVYMPSACGIFVYKLVPCIETSITFFRSLVFSL